MLFVKPLQNDCMSKLASRQNLRGCQFGHGWCTLV